VFEYRPVEARRSSEHSFRSRARHCLAAAAGRRGDSARSPGQQRRRDWAMLIAPLMARIIGLAMGLAAARRSWC
jgi:hypothetical protein